MASTKYFTACVCTITNKLHKYQNSLHKDMSHVPPHGFQCSLEAEKSKLTMQVSLTNIGINVTFTINLSKYGGRAYACTMVFQNTST